ncbi:hypothetical protein LUCX_34 [Xanthomonas phage vB_XciM_LucasX]|nr:hypothetical protein LUCX_34 [Xanthomonas phage vB_XciM_LucasX]
MDRFYEQLGVFWDWLLGDRSTVEYQGKVAHSKVVLRPSLVDDDVEIGVEISQITYETRFKHWWTPNTVQTVYRVVAFAPEAIRAQLQPQLFEPVVYPLLCNTLLRGSQYPHTYALHAFLDRLKPSYQTITCEL